MRELEVELPSGMKGIIKPWTTGDLQIFTDRKKLRQPGPTIEAALMRGAWLDTVFHGPYSFNGRPPWMQGILSGDLVDAVRWARHLTFGDYDTRFRCEETFCSEPIRETVPLAELPTKKYAPEDLDVFLNGDNRFAWTFPECEKEVIYGLSTGATLVRVDKLAKQHGRHLHVLLAGRVREIEGVRPGKFVDFMASVSATDSRELEDELDRREGGYSDDIELVCDECGLEQTQTLRVKPDFFRPEKPRTKTGDRTSTKTNGTSSPSDSQPSESMSESTSDSTISTG